MIASVYFELVNGERHTYINHTITKEEEIDWLLQMTRKILLNSFHNQDPPGIFSTIEVKPPEFKGKSRF